MAVQKSRKSKASTKKGRTHHNMSVPTRSVDKVSGESHLRHHVSPNGYYKGEKVDS